MLKFVEEYFIDLIKGRRKGIFPFLLKGPLWVLSQFFQIFVALRNWAYDKGVLRKFVPPVPVVISIGNIVAGGTGKTPVTLMLAQEFYHQFVIAILSRGYRSKAESLTYPVVLSRGDGPMHPAHYCGDEPYLLSKNLPKAFVFVGKNRYKASNLAVKSGTQLIILDDGMQHRRLARDFEVVVMDGYDPFGQGYFLPRGFLRDSLHSLSRADLIILNHVYDHEKFEFMKQQLSLYSSAPIVGTKMEVKKIWGINGEEMTSLQNKQVGIFCGIAHPEYFQHTIFNMGAEIVDRYFVPDHQDFDPKKLQAFAQSCFEKGAELLICTEKDWVKIPEEMTKSLSIGWIQMRLRHVEGEHYWKEFIKKVQHTLIQRI